MIDKEIETTRSVLETNNLDLNQMKNLLNRFKTKNSEMSKKLSETCSKQMTNYKFMAATNDFNSIIGKVIDCKEEETQNKIKSLVELGKSYELKQMNISALISYNEVIKLNSNNSEVICFLNLLILF